MDNAEEVLHSLDEFAKLKPKNIPRELEDYLMYVARTGDPVYQWQTVKFLFREKLLNVITEFYETTPLLDISPSPNVDPFNYETMKTVLLERLEAFSNAPFTVQRLCELLTTPRKEYNRPDKFMRAIEKNILVVSTREPGGACRPDSALSEPISNGISDPPEAATNQSSSSSGSTPNNEESIAHTSSSQTPKEPEGNGENHVAPESNSVEGSNHVAMDQVEPSAEAEVIKQEESENKSAVKDAESAEATISSDSLTFGEVNSATAATELVSVTSSENVTKLEVNDLKEQSTESLPESSDVESAPTQSSSSEALSVEGTETQNVINDVSLEVTKDADVSESEFKAESKDIDEVSSTPPSDSDKVTTAASGLPQPTEALSKVEESKEVVEESGSTTAESAVSSAQQDQPADSTDSTDSTLSDTTEDGEAPSIEVVSSGNTEVTTVSESVESVKNQELKDSDALESSEAAPAVVKVESEAKETVEAVKESTDANISSTESANIVTEPISSKAAAEATSKAVGAVDMEAMDVDESSNQPSEASAVDSEAMEVAEDEEPMDVCEDSTAGVEEMTTSPQESAL